MCALVLTESGPLLLFFFFFFEFFNSSGSFLSVEQQIGFSIIRAPPTAASAATAGPRQEMEHGGGSVLGESSVRPSVLQQLTDDKVLHKRFLREQEGVVL